MPAPPPTPALHLSLWASLPLAWCLPALRHLRDDAWDYDEGPLLQAAALARDGARLYSEVSLNKPPVFIWILRAGFALGRPDVASARLAVLAVTLAGFLSRRVLDPTASPRSRLLSAPAVAALALSLAPRSIPWRGRSSTMEAVVRDLQSVTAPGEYVVSDDPFMVFVAGRRAPPPLADTSNKSIVTGFLSSADALSAMRRYRVRVVVLGTGRLARMDAFLRAVRSASVDRRVIGDHERMVIDPARLR